MAKSETQRKRDLRWTELDDALAMAAVAHEKPTKLMRTTGVGRPAFWALVAEMGGGSDGEDGGQLGAEF